jgi:hypothetical protein
MSVMSALAIFSVSQPAGDNIQYPIDVTALAVRPWSAGSYIQAGTLMRPTAAYGGGHGTGFVYQASATGQTGSTEPTWPTTAGGTVTDGSITWTAIVPPAAGADTIAGVAWTQANPPDASLTITGQTSSGVVTSAFVGNGTSGNTYTVLVTVTMASGVKFIVQLVVAVL